MKVTITEMGEKPAGTLEIADVLTPPESHDIPYLDDYVSPDGKTVYIDREIPAKKAI